MWLVSAVSLAVTMILCLVGVFIPSRFYDDNLAQRAGMAGVFIVCWPRLVHLIDNQGFVGNCLPVAAQVLGHVGLALFAAGTAYKAWKSRPPRLGDAPPPPKPLRNLTHVGVSRAHGRGAAPR